jgi:acyl-CoA thioesterase
VVSGDAYPEAERRAARRDFDQFPLHKALGITLDEVRPGFARIVMRTGNLTLGGVAGSVHGGLLAAMVDMATLEALFPMFGPTDQPSGTADLNITYLRPALGAQVTAEATVLRKGRQLAVAEVEVFADDGRLCAKGRAIYSLRQAQSEPGDVER